MKEYSNPLEIVGDDTQLVLARHYTSAYVGVKEDSPDQSRLELIKRIKNSTSNFSSENFVLDLGAGRQILERDFFRLFGKPEFSFVSVDIAGLNCHQLLSRKKGVGHVRASGTSLPFRQDTFSIAVSNMALDFMPNGSIDELYRVVKPESPVYVNLHHADLIPADLDEKMNSKLYTRRTREVFRFWKYLRDNNILCANEDDVRQMFIDSNFKIGQIAVNGDSKDKWWEVELRT